MVIVYLLNCTLKFENYLRLRNDNNNIIAIKTTINDNSKDVSCNAHPEIRNAGYVTRLLSLLFALSKRWGKAITRGP
jgi:hypothetical protein